MAMIELVVFLYCRVCAENKYGISAPGEESDVVLNTVTEVPDSSDGKLEVAEASILSCNASSLTCNTVFVMPVR